MRSAKKRGRRRRFTAVALTVGALAGGAAMGHASTQGNTIPNGNVGQASTAMATYSVTSVAYTMNANTPQDIDKVTFTISPNNPRQVKATLYAGGPEYTCSNVVGVVTCTTTAPQATAATANNLTVVASQ